MSEWVFVRRQSPDWATLSQEYRTGVRVEPWRYLPDHYIPGFPPNVDRAIDRWNGRFDVDYFTSRAILAEISKQSIASIPQARPFSFRERESILDLAGRERFVLFFHDDDDLFASDLPERLDELTDDVDVHVFPLFRIHSEVVTFVREGQSAGAVLGARRDFDFRFQSNNYGLSSRILTDETLVRMKDHVEASDYATAHRLSEKVYPFAVSATIKTPCSASYLPRILEEPREFEREIRAFVKNLNEVPISEDYAWLKRSSTLIAALFDTVVSRKRVSDLPAELLQMLQPSSP